MTTFEAVKRLWIACHLNQYVSIYTRVYPKVSGLFTDSQNCDTTAPSGRELYHLQFSLRAASPETFGYTRICVQNLWSYDKRPLDDRGSQYTI
jgi:hypothetical protein